MAEFEIYPGRNITSLKMGDGMEEIDAGAGFGFLVRNLTTLHRKADFNREYEEEFATALFEMSWLLGNDFNAFALRQGALKSSHGYGLEVMSEVYNSTTNLLRFL